MSSVFFGCFRAYTLAPCLHNCFRMSTRNGKGAYAGGFPRLGAYANASPGFFVGSSCTW